MTESGMVGTVYFVEKKMKNNFPTVAVSPAIYTHYA